MNNSIPDATLQINVCAGDINYCDQTVAALIRLHRRDVREVIVVMDRCRPQSTVSLHRDTRFPRHSFAIRLAQLEAQCEGWRASGLVDRVIKMNFDREKLASLNFKYMGVNCPVSHDHLGHASAAYYLGWEESKTKYVLHFDGDILFYQQPGHSWVRQAIAELNRNNRLLAVSPRICPPPREYCNEAMVDNEKIPQCGWAHTWPLIPSNGGWISPWFSTRCHLIDRSRLADILPLTPTQGKASYLRGRWANTLLAPLFKLPIWTAPVPKNGLGNLIMRLVYKIGFKIPSFPLPPEVLVHESNQRLDNSILYLNDSRAWFIHPATKPELFVNILPQLLHSVEVGEFPSSQAGMCDIDFDEWAVFLSSKKC